MIKSIGVKVVSSRVKFHGKTSQSYKFTFVSQIFRNEKGNTVDAVAIGFCLAHKASWL